ncbi:MAG: DUF4157 domain-containing protein [Acidobacteriota bacterium]
MKSGNSDRTIGPRDLVNNAMETRMPKPLRHEMEKALQSDFSNLKIYESHLPTLVGAKSYATGNEIHFAPGGFDPFSQDGQTLVAHELAHVVQQREGRVAVQLKDTLDQLEAQAAAIGDRASQP